MTPNIWELGSELEGFKPKGIGAPNFCLSKYMILKLIPPKGKSVSDGLVMTTALLSFTDKDGQEVKTTVVSEGTNGYDIQFPLGKIGILATKFKGPMSFKYNRFVNPDTGKTFRISTEKFTVQYAKDLLANSIQNWSELSDADKSMHVDNYFENLYVSGLANDLAIETSKEVILRPGLVTSLYRRFTPAAPGEKYDNIIITKWPSKVIDDEKEFKPLDGSYKLYDEALALAILDKLQEREDTKFDPASFVDDTSDDDDS